ncbi:MAG: FecCD family ABC transporter permease [Jiangellaceae bacterium]
MSAPAAAVRLARVPRSALLLPALGVLLVAAVLVNVATGAVTIAPDQVLTSVLAQVGLAESPGPQLDGVLWAIRVPRVVLACLVGAGLGVAGASLQGVFRNPLADPGLLGVSSGAAVGAVGAIVLGLGPLTLAALPFAAFLGGLVAVVAAYAVARHDGRTEVLTLVLAGVAVNAVAGGVIGLLTYLADDAELRTITFWSLGSLGGATWRSVAQAAPFVVVGTVLLTRSGRTLNVLVLGDREARHLGLAPERSRLRIVALTALVTGAAVAVSGIVGFVGLVVPHLIRLLVGPDHRLLLPASALAGASVLLLADLLARMLVIPAELPLGVVTALVGGPFFLWLLVRTRRSGSWG